MSKDQRLPEKRLTQRSIEAWEERNKDTLRAALSKAERDVANGKGVAFDPMKPGAVFRRVVGGAKRRRAAA